MPQHYPGLIIFDCDGVLVDSEPISLAVLLDMITAGGGNVGEEEAYQRFLGMSMASVGTILSEDFAFEMTDDHLEAMRAELNRRFVEELHPVRGIREALDRLPMKRCVASSSGIERIRLSLKLTGLLEMFEPSIYSASMVARGKPAPDLFLHAAAAMGVAPRDCLVIEDSPAGVRAAQSAGMRVFAFAGGSHAKPAGLSKTLAALAPDVLFEDMAHLPDLIASEGRQARVS